MDIFFTGCTHFGHTNIIGLAQRPFDSVEEMDEVLIQNWNKTVKPTDLIYHLGDFAHKTVMSDRPRANRLMERLNGKKMLIKGNHDPIWFSEAAIQSLTNTELRVHIVLCHYPIEEWDGWWRGSLHLHCHTHKRELASAPRRFNVGVDATAYKPIALEDILAHPNARNERLERKH